MRSTPTYEPSSGLISTQTSSELPRRKALKRSSLLCRPLVSWGSRTGDFLGHALLDFAKSTNLSTSARHVTSAPPRVKRAPRAVVDTEVEGEVITLESRRIEYGIGLDFTPVVLSPGRISLKVRTSVSEPTFESPFNLGRGATAAGSAMPTRHRRSA